MVVKRRSGAAATGEAAMSAIVLERLCKSFGTAAVIHDVDLSIASGEFVVLVGPSGCGKSTLLRMVAGLEDITDGRVSIDGRVINDLAPADRDIAMVFQDYALYPHMSVAENMAFGLKMRKTEPAEITRRVAEAAEILKLGPLLDRRPAQLSGGQRQRVAMGRAIVRAPAAFLFDEPLSNLDAALRVELRFEIARLHRRMRATTLYVTHDQVEAMTLADRIVVMNAGRVEQVGRPMELYERPVSLFVARFIGSPTMNTLEARVVETASGLALDAAGVRIPVGSRTHGLAAGAAVVIGVRPEDLSEAAPDAAWLAGEVAMVERLGSHTFAHVEIGADRAVTVELPRTSDVAVGDPLALAGDPRRLHLFDPADGRRLAVDLGA
jgi:ABC-type sugar transport system ATPase subunit